MQFCKIDGPYYNRTIIEYNIEQEDLPSYLDGKDLTTIIQSNYYPIKDTNIHAKKYLQYIEANYELKEEEKTVFKTYIIDGNDLQSINMKSTISTDNQDLPTTTNNSSGGDANMKEVEDLINKKVRALKTLTGDLLTPLKTSISQNTNNISTTSNAITTMQNDLTTLSLQIQTNEDNFETDVKNIVTSQIRVEGTTLVVGD